MKLKCKKKNLKTQYHGCCTLVFYLFDKFRSNLKKYDKNIFKIIVKYKIYTYCECHSRGVSNIFQHHYKNS